MVNCPKAAVFTTLLTVLLLVVAARPSEWCKSTCENKSVFCLWDCESHSCAGKCTNDLKNCYSSCGRIKRKLMSNKYIDNNDLYDGFQ